LALDSAAWHDNDVAGAVGIEAGGMIRDYRGALVGERPLEMEMLGPGDYIGASEVKALAAGGLLLGGFKSFGMHFPKHHIFPTALKHEFSSRGINIDHHLIRLPLPVHQAIHHGRSGGPWNQAWKEFFEGNRNANAEDIYKYAGELFHRFGLPGGPIIKK
jgi:hypothetical protein